METLNQQKAPKKQKLTKKQRGFVRDYVLEENGARAVMSNYDVKDNIVAKSIASENLTKPYIAEAIEVAQKSLKVALGEAGVTPEKIAEKINKLLDHHDPNAIDKGLKHATAIHGITEDPGKKPEGNTYNFIFSPEVQGSVREIENKIKAQLIKKHVQEN